MNDMKSEPIARRTYKIPMAKRPGYIVVKKDGMPKEVATEMLCAGRLNGMMRRECQRAREQGFTVPMPQKAMDVRLAARFKRASVAQLAKWLRRREKRYSGVQRTYSKLQAGLAKLPEAKLAPHLHKAAEKLINMRIEAIRTEGSALEIYLTTIEDAIGQRRGKGTTHEAKAN